MPMQRTAWSCIKRVRVAARRAFFLVGCSLLAASLCLRGASGAQQLQRSAVLLARQADEANRWHGSSLMRRLLSFCTSGSTAAQGLCASVRLVATNRFSCCRLAVAVGQLFLAVGVEGRVLLAACGGGCWRRRSSVCVLQVLVELPVRPHNRYEGLSALCCGMRVARAT